MCLVWLNFSTLQLLRLTFACHRTCVQKYQVHVHLPPLPPQQLPPSSSSQSPVFFLSLFCSQLELAFMITIHSLLSFNRSSSSFHHFLFSLVKPRNGFLILPSDNCSFILAVIRGSSSSQPTLTFGVYSLRISTNLRFSSLLSIPHFLSPSPLL